MITAWQCIPGAFESVCVLSYHVSIPQASLQFGPPSRVLLPSCRITFHSRSPFPITIPPPHHHPLTAISPYRTIVFPKLIVCLRLDHPFPCQSPTSFPPTSFSPTSSSPTSFALPSSHLSFSPTYLALPSLLPLLLPSHIQIQPPPPTFSPSGIPCNKSSTFVQSAATSRFPSKYIAFRLFLPGRMSIFSKRRSSSTGV